MPYAVSKSDCYLIRIHVEVGLCFLGSFEDNLTVFTLWTLVPKTLYRLAGVWFCWPGDSNVITEIQKFDKCKWFTSTLRHMLTAFLLSFLLQLLFVQSCGSPSPVAQSLFFRRSSSSHPYQRPPTGVGNASLVGILDTRPWWGCGARFHWKTTETCILQNHSLETGFCGGLLEHELSKSPFSRGFAFAVDVCWGEGAHTVAPFWM